MSLINNFFFSYHKIKNKKQVFILFTIFCGSCASQSAPLWKRRSVTKVWVEVCLLSERIEVIGSNHRCIGYYFPRYATPIFQHEKRCNQLLVIRNCISICLARAKRSMFNVFYVGGTWILSEHYKFHNYCTTLIF